MDCGFEIAGKAWLPPAYLTSSPASATLAPVAPIAPTAQASPAAPSRRMAVQATRLLRIHRYVETNFDNPDLSARSCARALGMSVRSLHQALAYSSTTFGALVMRRRLQLCRRLLQQWDQVESVADLAFACGFNSLSSFYRAFRSQFGTCPGALRQA
jgi:transcriptional regulator GlxA family with amidase domain